MMSFGKVTTRENVAAEPRGKGEKADLLYMSTPLLSYPALAGLRFRNETSSPVF